jgi:hypothetical protein
MKTEFTFYELLRRGETRQFVVPELQRDYVWEKKNWLLLLENLQDAYETSLEPIALQVSGAAELQQEFLAYYRQQRHSYNLGFLYAYHDPAYAGHCFLIDGQQRLTTLFLLLLAAAQQAGRTDHFARHYLTATGTPSLAYRVREAADEFFFNFVHHVLAEKSVADLTEKSAQRPYWYFSSYTHDATVSQLLANYRGMATWLAAAPFTAGAGAVGFYDYLHESVRFWYFDTSQSAQGEDLYLSLNASSEPLTGSDNIKAQLLSDLPSKLKNEWGEKFEEWEQFFWLYCEAASESGRDASLGFDEFFRWVAICYTLEGNSDRAAVDAAKGLLRNPSSKQVQAALFPKSQAQLSTEEKALVAEERLVTIGRYLDALRGLFDLWLPQAQKQVATFWEIDASAVAAVLPDLGWLRPSKTLDAADCLRLLPVMVYLAERARLGDMLTVETVSSDGPQLFRVVRYFYNLHRVQRVGKNSVALCITAIRSAFQLTGQSADIAYLFDLPATTPTLDTELDKLHLFRQPLPDATREQLERLCWQLEDYTYNQGEVAHLVGDLKTASFQELQTVDYKYQALFDGTSITSKLLQTVLLSFGMYAYQSSNNSYYVNYRFDDWHHNVRQPAFRSLITAFSGQSTGLSTLYQKQKNLLLKDVEPGKPTDISALHEQLFFLASLFDSVLSTAIFGGSIWSSGNYAGWYYSEVAEEAEQVFSDKHRLLNSSGPFGYNGYVSLLTKLRQYREDANLSYVQLVERMLVSLNKESVEQSGFSLQ